MSKKPNLLKTLHESVNTGTSRQRLFVPTLGSTEAVAFWLGLVFFLSLYGILVQFDYVTSLQHLGLLFFDFFLVQALVVFSIIGYTHLSIASYQSLSIFEQSKRILITTLVLTPIATLLGKFIEIMLGFQEIVVQNIFVEAMINTILASVLVPLLLYYFGWQYAKILNSQQRYHQKLVNQNAQLKARITPHFFFNMLNTLQYLSETDPTKSNELLQSIAKLYRVSFYDPTEIGLNEEVILCEHYLKVEQYRFGDKLHVHWELPDEDTLYDMSIPSLMIQMTIEKLILAMVDISTQTIHLSVQIAWKSHWVSIQVKSQLSPPNSSLIHPTLHPASSFPQDLTSPLASFPILDFSSQRHILQQFYGNTASIEFNSASNGQPLGYTVDIHYPLKDIGLAL